MVPLAKNESNGLNPVTHSSNLEPKDASKNSKFTYMEQGMVWGSHKTFRDLWSFKYVYKDYAYK